MEQTRAHRFHLVSYATSQFRHRQWFLGASARANHVVTSVTAWTPRMLVDAGFLEQAPGISISERGSGYWAWKPFIIRDALNRIPEGEFVLYCDVGRKYPYLLLNESLNPFVDWMHQQGQDVLPGVQIPWSGSMEKWTKRAAFTGTEVDGSEALAAIPIQASFSLWRSGPTARSFVDEWMTWCFKRNLVSDDHCPSNDTESSVFVGHRHDQSLLTLKALKEGMIGLDIGTEAPAFNDRDPNEILRLLTGHQQKTGLIGRALCSGAFLTEAAERLARKFFKFGVYYEKVESLDSGSR
jgi:hypothetical protein